MYLIDISIWIDYLNDRYDESVMQLSTEMQPFLFLIQF